MAMIPHCDIQFHISKAIFTMYLVAIAWIYVVVMMAAAEATSANGSVLGAVITLLLYGALPLSLVMYLLGTPMRRRARLAAEQAQGGTEASITAQPDGAGHAPGDPIATERKEP
jgi:membrane protein implicated in regulation of membrane protease activity